MPDLIPVTTGTAREDQQDLYEYIYHVVCGNWAGPLDRPEFEHLRPIPARIDASVHSFLVQLRGDGGIDPHRLAPKTNPDLDLFDLGWSLEHAYPLNGKGHEHLPAEAVAFLDAVEAAAGRAKIAPDGRIRVYLDVLTGFYRDVFAVIEASYVLVPLNFNEGGNLVGARADIAPGLVAGWDAFLTEEGDR